MKEENMNDLGDLKVCDLCGRSEIATIVDGEGEPLAMREIGGLCVCEDCGKPKPCNGDCDSGIKSLSGHDWHCPVCNAHLTSLLLCPECGTRFYSQLPKVRSTRWVGKTYSNRRV